MGENSLGKPNPQHDLKNLQVSTGAGHAQVPLAEVAAVLAGVKS